MKKLNKTTLVWAVITLLIILFGIYTGYQFDAISFSYTNPEVVNQCRVSYQNRVEEAEIKFYEDLGTFVSPQ